MKIYESDTAALKIQKPCFRYKTKYFDFNVVHLNRSRERRDPCACTYICHPNQTLHALAVPKKNIKSVVRKQMELEQAHK